jgi:hypothetical protein
MRFWLLKVKNTKLFPKYVCTVKEGFRQAKQLAVAYGQEPGPSNSLAAKYCIFMLNATFLRLPLSCEADSQGAK